MDKTSEKVTKDPKCIESGRKGRKNFMNKLKKDILNDAKKGSGDTTNTSNETTIPTTNASNEATGLTNIATTPANNTTTTCLWGWYTCCPCHMVLVYFLHITLSLKVKNSSVKNRMNHQNDVICFRKIYIINE